MDYRRTESSKCNEITIQIDGELRLNLLVANGNHDRWLVLWPGMGATAKEFISTLRLESKMGINVAAIDPPGHGFSDVWQDDFSKESVNKIWDSIFSTLNISEAFIGGHSYGAYAAIWGATYLGKTVKGLVLLDGGYLEPFLDVKLEKIFQQNQLFLESRQFDSWGEFFLEEKKTARQWNRDIEEMLASTMTELNNRIVPRISIDTANQVSSIIEEFSISSLPYIKAPSLLLYASLPKEFENQREQGIKRLNEKLENLSIIPVPDSGHDLLVDNPEFVDQNILNFIVNHK